MHPDSRKPDEVTPVVEESQEKPLKSMFASPTILVTSFICTMAYVNTGYNEVTLSAYATTVSVQRSLQPAFENNRLGF
jgi:hypothetical protein